MDYLASYKSLASSIREEAPQTQRKAGGLASRDLRPLDVEVDTNVQEKYMSMVKAMFKPSEQQGTITPEETAQATESAPMESSAPPASPKFKKMGSDPEFEKEAKRLAEKHGFTVNELYKVIQGESGFNPQAQNKSGATGLFQFMPSTAAELGWTTEEIKDMAPTEQLRVYDQYLSRWDYNPENELGIMQAAPAYASKSGDSVIYKRGTAAWEQNPGWRPSSNGDITVDSINAYYRKKKV